MDSCSEARSVGLALKLDYFLVSSQRFYGDDSIGRGWIKSYINLEVDTFWLTREDAPIISLPEDVHFICGKCQRLERFGIPPDCEEGCLGPRGDSGPPSFRRLAMDFNKWLDPDDEGAWGMANMELLVSNCVRELLLVVGDVESFEDKRDVIFVAPRQRPWLTYLYMTRTRGHQTNRGLEKLEEAAGTWKHLEAPGSTDGPAIPVFQGPASQG
jgi:hypothetical protein